MKSDSCPTLPASFASVHRTSAERWPGVRLTLQTFAEEVEDRRPAHVAPREWLRVVRAADVYLVAACLRSDPQAWRFMEIVHLAALERRLARTLPIARAHEVYDALREQLLPDRDRPSLLHNYAGRSSLRTWLLGVLRRKEHETHREHRRRERIVLGKSDEVTGRTASTSSLDPELAYLRRHFSQELKRALRDALGTMTSVERALFRRHLLGQCNIDELGVELGVHRATAARRVARVRARLVAQIHDALTARLGLDAGEASRLRHLLADNLELSVTRLL